MVARSRSLHPLTVFALVALAVLATAPGLAQEEEQAPAPDARIENPAADAAVEPSAVDPADQQGELAIRIFPSLLELGLDVMPGDDQAKSVLTAVNALRRQDNQRPLAALDEDAVGYVEQKVAAYRTQRTLTIRIQGALEALGFEPGPIDGVYGPLTTESVRKYQRSAGLAPSGALTAEQVDALEMKSIDRIMRPPEAKRSPEPKPSPGAQPPRDDPDAVAATPAAKAPEIDSDLLDYIGR
jgi:hypothetical protein